MGSAMQESKANQELGPITTDGRNGDIAAEINKHTDGEAWPAFYKSSMLTCYFDAAILGVNRCRDIPEKMDFVESLIEEHKKDTQVHFLYSKQEQKEEFGYFEFIIFTPIGKATHPDGTESYIIELQNKPDINYRSLGNDEIVLLQHREHTQSFYKYKFYNPTMEEIRQSDGVYTFDIFNKRYNSPASKLQKRSNGNIKLKRNS
jgi:hypothetical protein